MSPTASKRPFKPRAKSKKLLARFYEVIVLSSILGSVQGDRIQGEAFESDDPRTYNEATLRRKTLDSLCVICDFEKGGETVTSISLGQGERGPDYWLAANSKANRIQDFLQLVLSYLSEVASQADLNEEEVQEHLFDMITRFNAPRLKKTWDLLQQSIRRELNLIKDASAEDDRIAAYEKWLGTFLHPCDGLPAYVAACQNAYSERRCDLMQLATRTDILKKARHNLSENMVRHYIGRLGSTLRAAKVITQAAKRQPHLFQEYEIILCPYLAASAAPDIDPQLTLNGIAKRMVSSDSSTTVEELQEKLAKLDLTLGIEEDIKERYLDPTFKPRVHAELMVMEHVYREGVRFYDGDKYIACSKPACFCCYHYIASHPGNFVRPPSHNNLWIKWRPPGCVASDDKDSKRRRNAMDGLIKAARGVAIEKINSSDKRNKRRTDSTSGITSSVAESVFTAKQKSLVAAQALSKRVDGLTNMLDDLKLGNVLQSTGRGAGARSTIPAYLLAAQYSRTFNKHSNDVESAGQIRPSGTVDDLSDDVSVDGGVAI